MITNLNLQNELTTKIKAFLSSLTDVDIYAISFEFSADGNPCEPDFAVCYNTERDYQNELAKDYDEGLSAAAQRWNCAYWSRENPMFLDAETMAIIKQWITGMGLKPLTYDEYFGAEGSREEVEAMIDDYDKIDAALRAISVDIIKHLHESGFIKSKFGRDIPVIIHVHGDYDDVDELVAQNIEANTLSLVQEFVGFYETGW